MRWIYSALLSPLVLAVLANGSPIAGDYFSDVEERNETLTLFRRVRTGPNGELLDPKTAADLFLLDDGPGGCQGQEATLDAWVEESMLLHAAIEELHRNVAGDRSKMLLWFTWFGIQFDRSGQVDLDDDFNEQVWKNIGDHIARVSKFLAGGGLENPQVAGEKPRMFCGPEAGEIQDWNRAVTKDKNGEDVVATEDEETGVKTYLRLGDAFPSASSDSKTRAFWFESFKGYDFDYAGRDTLCDPNPEDGRRRYAKTARPTSSWPPITIRAPEFEFGKANRHILFCPPSFDPSRGAHSYPSLAEAIDEDNYPSAGSRIQSEALNMMLPVSATLYHELYHLTDDDNTKDQKYQAHEILSQARSTDTRVGNSHNPETFTFIATAAYLYLRAPASEEPCLYISPFPAKASDPFNQNRGQ
ncbi:hypothetical protein BJY04DRAFT_208654 [Aspergillus karnatakaensis]|uniref:uncharacterized protein n=1 Tax=Aspergillus karnatakaensis TaxID=1810916 RepID=UPI003CCD481B